MSWNIKEKLREIPRGDKILIVLVLFLSLFGLLYPYLGGAFSDAEDLEVIIHSMGEEKERIALSNIPDEGKKLIVSGPIGDHTVEITAEGVRVIAPEEDPLKICERTGWINNPGTTIVCVPNNLAIWLEGTDLEEDLDGISE